MGVYDTYGDEQLKVGESILKEYRLGDEVTIGDGIYFGLDSAIVISHKIFIAQVPYCQMYDKWGNGVGEHIKGYVEGNNPLMKTLDS